MNWPNWWDWELGFTGHVEVRMEERGFSEVELRSMLDRASRVSPARRPGRWLIHTQHSGQPWVVVAEPDPQDQMLMIVTAYPDESRCLSIPFLYKSPIVKASRLPPTYTCPNLDRGRLEPRPYQKIFS